MDCQEVVFFLLNTYALRHGKMIVNIDSIKLSHILCLGKELKYHFFFLLNRQERNRENSSDKI